MSVDVTINFEEEPNDQNRGASRSATGGAAVNSGTGGGNVMSGGPLPEDEGDEERPSVRRSDFSKRLLENLVLIARDTGTVSFRTARLLQNILRWFPGIADSITGALQAITAVGRTLLERAGRPSRPAGGATGQQPQGLLFPDLFAPTPGQGVGPTVPGGPPPPRRPRGPIVPGGPLPGPPGGPGIPAGSGGRAAAGVAAVLRGFGAAVGIATVAAFGVTAALKLLEAEARLLSAQLDKVVQDVQAFSSEVIQVSVEEQIRALERQIRRAQILGGPTASAAQVRSDIRDVWNEIKTSFIVPTLKFFEAIELIALGILEALKPILQLLGLILTIVADSVLITLRLVRQLLEAIGVVAVIESISNTIRNIQHQLSRLTETAEDRRIFDELERFFLFKDREKKKRPFDPFP